MLKNKTYSFEYGDSNEIRDSALLFFFFNPSGTWKITYNKGINGNTAISTLGNNVILGAMRFTSADRKQFSEVLLRYNEKEHELYFHSLKSEIELWKIFKKISHPKSTL